MSLIKERIKELRVLNCLTQKALSDILSVTEVTVQRYEYGDRIPELDRLIALADYFDVSLDYIVGRTNNPKRLK